MDAVTDYILLYPAPIIGVAAAWGMWRAETKAPTIGRWRGAAAGLSMGLLGWPAVAGITLTIGSTLLSLVGNALWLLLALVTWTPGRG